MAQPDTITKDIPADGQVGVARVLQVIREEAESEGWCDSAEEAVSRFLKIDVLSYEKPGAYCCSACSGGLTAQQYADKRGYTAWSGYSFTRFTPSTPQPDFMPTARFVDALKATRKIHPSYQSSLDKIGREVLGPLWIGFPTAWTCYANRTIRVETEGSDRPTQEQVNEALERIITDLRETIKVDQFYQN